MKDREKEVQDIEFSLERIYPNDLDLKNPANNENLKIHMQRYEFASLNLKGQQILDIACGCGYGTALMAKNHPEKQFLGVDCDPNAVSYAQQSYQAANLKFVVGDAMSFNVKSSVETSWKNGADTIISLETIEHVLDPQGLIKNLLKGLSEGGAFIGSVPTTPTMDGNPHHLHDFTLESFYKLFTNHGFEAAKKFPQVQPWKLKGAFSKKKAKDPSVDNRSQGVGLNALRHYRKKPSALFSRVSSLFVNGLNNKYMTAQFLKSK